MENQRTTIIKAILKDKQSYLLPNRFKGLLQGNNNRYFCIGENIDTEINRKYLEIDLPVYDY